MRQSFHGKSAANSHGAQLEDRALEAMATEQQRGQKRSVGKTLGWVMGVLVVVGLSPWWINKALQAIVAPPNTTGSAEAIVVLGRGPNSSENRTEAAVQLWQEGRAPQVFISGVMDAPVLLELAKEMGVPDAHIDAEGCSRSTWENAFYSEKFMPPGRAAAKPKILLVTDDLHIVRSTLVFRSFGFEVLPSPVRTEPAAWRQHVFREFFVLVYYTASGWFQTPTAEQYQAAEVEAKTRIPDWECLPSYENFERGPIL